MGRGGGGGWQRRFGKPSKTNAVNTKLEDLVLLTVDVNLKGVFIKLQSTDFVSFPY